MAPHQPQDWPASFEESLSSGDLQRVMELYESNACFIDESGEKIVGREAIGQVISGLIAAKTRLHGKVVKATTVDDITMLYTNWHGLSVDAAGKTAATTFLATEILRPQQDGTWKLIIGDPNAHKRM